MKAASELLSLRLFFAYGKSKQLWPSVCNLLRVGDRCPYASITEAVEVIY
jgi:hypothetical protein